MNHPIEAYRRMARHARQNRLQAIVDRERAEMYLAPSRRRMSPIDAALAIIAWCLWAVIMFGGLALSSYLMNGGVR